MNIETDYRIDLVEAESGRIIHSEIGTAEGYYADFLPVLFAHLAESLAHHATAMHRQRPGFDLFAQQRAFRLTMSMVDAAQVKR
jgi:hypothetical protein